MRTGPPIESTPASRRPGELVWRLTHPDGRVQRCELRDDAGVGAGVDVLLLDGDGGLILSRRCVDRAGAVFVADAMKQDGLRADWTEAAD